MSRICEKQGVFAESIRATAEVGLVTGLGSPIANRLVLDLDNTVARVSGSVTYQAPEGQGANQLELIQNGTTAEGSPALSFSLLSNGTNTDTAEAAGSAGILPVEIANGVSDKVMLLGSGNDSVLVGDGNNDRMSVSGDSYDVIQRISRLPFCLEFAELLGSDHAVQGDVAAPLGNG